MRTSILVPLLSLSLLTASPLMAQSRNSGCPKTTDYPCGSLPVATPEIAGRLLDALRHSPEASWDSTVLRPFFGQLYDGHYTDWVVFIDSHGRITRQGLFRDGKFVDGDRLRGDETIWLVAFATSKLGLSKPEKEARERKRASDLDDAAAECNRHGLNCAMDITLDGGNPAYVEDKDDPAALRFGRLAITSAQDPVLLTAFRVLAGGILGDAQKKAPPSDTTISVKLDSLAVIPGTDDADTLFVGLSRLTIPDDAIVRLSLRPNGKHDFPGQIGIFRNIRNGRRSPWVAGLAAAGTFNAAEDEINDGAVTGRTDRFRTSLLLYLGTTLEAGQVPQGIGAISLVGGTNVVTGDLFRDLFLGLSLSGGNDLTVLAGLDYALIKSHSGGTGSVTEQHHRKARFMLGVGLSLR